MLKAFWGKIGILSTIALISLLELKEKDTDKNLKKTSCIPSPSRVINSGILFSQ